MKRYGLARLTEQELKKEHGITLSKEETDAFMASLKPEDKQVMDHRRHPDHKAVYVRYKGEWLQLCREDLDRQVKTYRETIEDCERMTALYGARIEDGTFTIVDSTTDG